MARIVYLGVEDDLSEAIARRTLLSLSREIEVGAVFGRRGFGDLKRKIDGWNDLAKIFPFLLLTDLDDSPCPPALIKNWHPRPLNKSLFFRVAVREVEAWLLADRVGFAKYIGISEEVVPPDPESVPDPKAALVQMAKRSKIRSIRERIVPRPGSTAQIGPDYNACLGEFVQTAWNIGAASKTSPSLKRAILRLRSII